MLDPKDGGWKSRKLWVTIWSMHLILVAGLIAAKWAVLGPYLTILVGGITAVVGMYFGSSVAHTHVMATNAKSIADAQNSLTAPAEEASK